jgi:hypothetical protein
MTAGFSNHARLHRGKFLFSWIAANLIGGFLVGFLENNGLQFMATLMLTGAILGSLQWLVLRGLGNFRMWPLASAIGWIVSTFAGAAAQGLYQPVVEAVWQQVGLWDVFRINLTTGLIAALGMAIAQALVLNRRGRSVFVWLLASGLGGVAQSVVSSATCAAFCPVLKPLWVGTVYGVGWAAYGLLTGMAILWIFDRTRQVEEVI